ncbi:MAG: hypothetical protein ABIF87_07050 [Pseudomonadota bacterium]
MTMFRCERFHCTMTLTACRKRRDMKSSRPARQTQNIGESCRGCVQWKKVCNEKNPDERLAA